MSTNQHHQAHAAENPAGGSGIRLPPISFISTGHQSQPISSITQSLEKPNHGENKQIGGFNFQSIKQSFLGDQKMSLPEPQTLNLYPKRTSHSPQSAESSAGFIDAQKPEPALLHQQHHQPTKAPNHLHGLLEHDLRRLRGLRAEFLEHTREIGYGEKTAYVPIIPPLSEAYINNLLEVKIPYKFIKSFHENLTRGVVERERKLWGGYAGIYTDDSDLLHVLCHLGLFNGKLDLTECNSEWTERDVTRPAHVQEDDDGVELLDLSVTILLLPGLVQYRGFCRNGLNSRLWVDKPAHSGLSIAVYNVKWETVFLALGERALSKRAAKEYMEDKISSAEFLAQKNGWLFDSALYETLRKKMHAAKLTDLSAAADHVP
ncbi:hypothetical protein HF325_005533 [Metschnikowia pulcherrima]|uniref:Histone deacetylation protein Rxt3 n=1 Tax=Metschnikowia pulcherrima TaxID=27326 RepID=A0A8H7L943_9ASCO|nr:hypothetical protein HF325_005533 [Metschnikowia pulcherrima]